MPRNWTEDDVLSLARSYQTACVLSAAADLDIFSHLHAQPATASSLAHRLGSDGRAATILLDALVAIQLLAKHEGSYSVPEDIAELLTETSSRGVLPMVQHQANCLRRWAQLTRVVKSAGPAECAPSIRGESADQAAFIGAMHNVSGQIADRLVAELGPPAFRRLLDVGGASGTWTIAFLRAVPGTTAIVFDLPPVIPMARQRIAEAGLGERVTFVAGDFYGDPLPAGADLVWLSAIAHQNSREQNRALFGRIHAALADGGAILIRDVVMDESHTRPVAGALFAVNMLVGTAGGGTFTFSEFREDLEAAGFTDVKLLRQDEAMNSLVRAEKRTRPAGTR